MTHSTTRARQIQFLSGFGSKAVRQALDGMLIRKRLSILDVLSDSMVEELASRLVSDERATQHRNFRNRALFAQQGVK